MLAYRDAIRSVDGASLRRELQRRLEAAGLASAREAARLALLLLAAELETALEDLEAAGRHGARAFTDACAQAWVRAGELDHERWRRELAALVLPERLALKRPEGYAYYALDPAAYARAAAAVAPASPALRVIGVRSIGTSASAIVAAAVRAGGRTARRVTVRPEGHPWDRRCALRGEDCAALLRAPGDCVVVDEGPGISGSTFLAVAEGLEQAGVPRERITLLTSHVVDPERLVARDAVQRWSRFRSLAVPVRTLQEEAGGADASGGARDAGSARGVLQRGLDVSAGRWREVVFASERQWPFVWSSVERRKRLAPARGALSKFVGLPPYGEAPLARGRALADAGFSPPVEPLAQGYLLQRWVSGRVRGRASELVTPGFLEHVVEYLAFRSRAFPADGADGGLAALEAMTRENTRQALGVELPEQRLELRHAVYADARLAPHEWVASGDRFSKVDATDHADDHFFPGPCDTAWDLAGAIVELGLDAARADAFLASYARRTGDDARRRVGPYLIAYVAARVGRLQIASFSTSGAERERLDRELAAFTEGLRALVHAPTGSAASVAVPPSPAPR